MTLEEVHLSEGCFVSEWSNTPEDPAVSIARARVPPGVTTRWHRLAGTTERYVILEGTGRAHVGDAAPRQVAPGDTYWLIRQHDQHIAVSKGMDT